MKKITLMSFLLSGIAAVIFLGLAIYENFFNHATGLAALGSVGRFALYSVLFISFVIIFLVSLVVLLILRHREKRKAENDGEKSKILVNRIFVYSAIISAILLCLIVLIYIFGTSWSALKLFFLCLFLFIASCTICLASFIAKDRRKFNRQEKIAFGVCLGSGIAAFVLYWILMRFSRTFSNVGCLEIVEFLFLAFIIMCLITFVVFLVLRHMNKRRLEKGISEN